jgi:hypothetical protein
MRYQAKPVKSWLDTIADQPADAQQRAEEGHHRAHGEHRQVGQVQRVARSFHTE